MLSSADGNAWGFSARALSTRRGGLRYYGRRISTETSEPFRRSWPHPPTSLFLEKQRQNPDAEPVILRELLTAFLEAAEKAADRLEEGGLPAILPEYRARSVTIGSAVRVIAPTEEYIGQAEGMDASGSLLVRDGSGRSPHRCLRRRVRPGADGVCGGNLSARSFFSWAAKKRLSRNPLFPSILKLIKEVFT